MTNAFGKYAIIDPVTFHFEREPGWWWKIKPPTAGDEIVLRRFMIAGRVEVTADGTRREYFPNLFEQAHREVALTFAGTNIPAEEDKSVEDGGEPYIKVGAAVETVEACLKLMPHDFVMEIWYQIGLACPGWGPIVIPNADGSQTAPAAE